MAAVASQSAARYARPMKKSILLGPLALAALLPISAHGQPEEPVLTGREAIERIIGNTIVLAPTKPLPTLAVRSFIYFSPDGRAAMQIAASERADEEEKTETRTGSWSIDDQERLCVVEEGKALREEDCTGMRVAGNIVQSVPEKIFGDATATLVEGNLRGL